MDDPQYQDDDLVYVDPESRTVLGCVTFDEKSGKPRSLPVRKEEGKDAGRSWRTCYPWGTYRSMKRAFRLVGKVWEEKGEAKLEDVLPTVLGDAW